MRGLGQLSTKELLDKMFIETVNCNVQKSEKHQSKFLRELQILTAGGGIKLAQYFQLCRSCLGDFIGEIMESELKTLQTRGFIQSYDENGKIRIGEPGKAYRTYLGEQTNQLCQRTFKTTDSLFCCYACTEHRMIIHFIIQYYLKVNDGTLAKLACVSKDSLSQCRH